MDFDNKVVLVTGSSRGIGAAIACAFAAQGASVIINFLNNEHAATRVVRECEEAGGTAVAIRGDVLDSPSVKNLVQESLDVFGKINVLVNNAFRPYVFNPKNRRRFWELDWNDYQEQIDGALKSTYNLCRAVLPELQKHPSGSIVNMVTDLVGRPIIPYHDYTTAKAALIGFSRTLAAEFAPIGIRVNCVAPGLVYPTDGSKDTPEETKDAIAAATPLGRIASPEDIAGPVLFLASEWSRFMTGQTLYVDGGLVMN